MDIIHTQENKNDTPPFSIQWWSQYFIHKGLSSRNYYLKINPRHFKNDACRAREISKSILTGFFGKTVLNKGCNFCVISMYNYYFSGVHCALKAEVLSIFDSGESRLFRVFFGKSKYLSHIQILSKNNLVKCFILLSQNMLTSLLILEISVLKKKNSKSP